jgi:hypothetical protein
MTLKTQTLEHRNYEVVITHTPPYFQPAIYPTEPNLPPVDWQLVPIRAADVKGALDLAKRRINEAYARRADQAAASQAANS